MEFIAFSELSSSESDWTSRTSLVIRGQISDAYLAPGGGAIIIGILRGPPVRE